MTLTQKLYKKREQIARDLVIILLAFIVILEFFYLWIDNIFFKSGYVYTSLYDTKTALERENLVLTDQIASSSSLQVIKGKSGALGFKEISGIKWIK